MTDPTRNFHGGNPNSRAAFEVTETSRPADIRKVVELLGSCPPLACGLYPHANSDEVQRLLERQADAAGKHQTASARFTDAKALGLIVSAGHNHETRSGCWGETFRIADSTACFNCGSSSPAIRDALISKGKCPVCGLSRARLLSRRKTADQQLIERLIKGIIRVQSLCERSELVSSAAVLAILDSV